MGIERKSKARRVDLKEEGSVKELAERRKEPKRDRELAAPEMMVRVRARSCPLWDS